MSADNAWIVEIENGFTGSVTVYLTGLPATIVSEQPGLAELLEKVASLVRNGEANVMLASEEHKPLRTRLSGKFKATYEQAKHA